ncbi:MAG: ABC transporter ATP-binding protein/permease [Faecalibacterium sp.]|nr:ABC transporter ATP-binding protein/permease [Ruminococcus sp.]MCM1392608.1 ABC transporter ATP-binding protein/permease [Ruminococcus sp.]MCM1486529.1 ABC transporter ATP-binding protein/permease [Faecalibacterium sp.]
MAQNNQPQMKVGGKGPGKMPARGMPKQKVKKGTSKRLFKYIAYKNKLKLFVVIICIAVSAIASVSSSLFIKTVITAIEEMVATGSTDWSGFITQIVQIACIFAAGIVASYVQSIVMAYVSQGVLKNIRNDMFSHMQSLPIKYFDTNTHGDIMSHFTNDTDTLRQMISQTIPQAVSSVVTVITVFTAMLVTSWQLTIFVVISIALMLTITGKVAGKSGKYFVKQQKSLGDVNGYIEEMITGQKVIKVFCHEEKAKDEFDEKNEELFTNAYKAHKYVNIIGPINNNLGHLQYVLLAIIGGLFAVAGVGGLNMASVAAFLQLSKSFVNPVNQVSQQLNSVVMALAGAERVFDLMDEQSETDGGYVTLVNVKNENGKLTESAERTGHWAWKHPHSDGSVTYTELKGEVVFDDVDFSYDGEKTVLHNISLYAEQGQKVAFVGATGAGKTTITNLINRFYDIADGKVRYDGININKIKKSDLRRSLGIVLQDTNLFTGTVMENIRYGNLDATDEEVYNAARLANADDFIRRLPNGYDTMLTGNGANLSQGQRQLISIARAAVADPPVMILDEATSSIDTRTEALVQKGMDALMKGRTVFVIAHRLSTVQNSDVIMVLEHGKIIERGNHEKLIEEGGTYCRLYTGAFELE